ncbi:MAG: crossover junction endodeoxyribonuclease RuvC [Candidatus Dojkabacteria bacterium]|nr:MAG: crossover junction endodeoxyribonuclease RuvC [Candidatus Dojkabacteria bacterium]
MKVLGIDPGYAIVGWGVVEIDGTTSSDYNGITLIECGVIRTDSKLTLPERLNEIFTDINQIFGEFNPDLVGIETLLFQTNVKTAMAVSEARGVIMLAAHQANLTVQPVTPSQVKSSIAGYGKADKKQVQESVRLLCGLAEVPKPDDAADAVAIAIAANSLYRM